MKRFAHLILGLALVALVGTAASVTTASVAPVPENLPLALEQQRTLVAEQPGNAAARNDLGNLLLLMGDLEGAEVAYRDAIELAPERPGYRYNLALMLHEAGEVAAAADLYMEVLELAPRDAWAHYQLGSIREAQGQDKRAIALYGEAFRLDPSLAFADVNPLVLESDLVTEAMLTGYRRGVATSRAPRVYNDPNRIARLLVVDPELEDDEPAPPPPGMRAEEEPAGVMMGQEPDDPMPAGERKVLDSNDISNRPVNQATPNAGAGAGYRPPQQNRVRSIRPPDQPQAGGGGNAAAQRGRNQGRGNQGGNDNGGVAGSVLVGGNAPGDPPDTPAVGGPNDPRRRRLPDRGNPIGSTGSLTLELGDPEPVDQNG